VLGDLFEIAGQHRDDFVDFGARVLVECRDAWIGGFLQLVEQFDREAGKVVDEVGLLSLPGPPAAADRLAVILRSQSRSA
jgi:hypothetical protein